LPRPIHTCPVTIPAAPNDYDGDGHADIAVWRPSDGDWHILKSSTGYNAGLADHPHWGDPGDIPLGRNF
jgi:hypothetical protein